MFKPAWLCVLAVCPGFATGIEYVAGSPDLCFAPGNPSVCSDQSGVYFGDDFYATAFVQNFFIDFDTPLDAVLASARLITLPEATREGVYELAMPFWIAADGGYLGAPAFVLEVEDSVSNHQHQITLMSYDNVRPVLVADLGPAGAMLTVTPDLQAFPAAREGAVEAMTISAMFTLSLIPVPEPAIAGLTALGLILLALRKSF